jgi:hypothetical protein
MTAPAEDPRGGECQQSDWCGPGSHCLCRPAGDRAQPTQELREAIARGIAESRPWGERWDSLADCPGDALRNEYRKTADAVLALPALAALLDAQAAVNRVEAAINRHADNLTPTQRAAFARALIGTT